MPGEQQNLENTVLQAPWAHMTKFKGRVWYDSVHMSTNAEAVKWFHNFKFRIKRNSVLPGHHLLNSEQVKTFFSRKSPAELCIATPSDWTASTVLFCFANKPELLEFVKLIRLTSDISSDLRTELFTTKRKSSIWSRSRITPNILRHKTSVTVDDLS